jgi:hypothetical protein
MQVGQVVLEQHGGLSEAVRVLEFALPSALSALFLSTAAPPLWFCVLCPAVLGLVAPLVINIGLNQVIWADCAENGLHQAAALRITFV